MGPAIHIGEQCQYCGKWRNPLEVIHLPGGVVICLECEERHQEALIALATGEFHGVCSECGKTAEELRSRTGEMIMHFERNRYRAMCAQCDLTYVSKRSDLYGATQFGYKRGLK